MYLKMIDHEDTDKIWAYLTAVPEDENGFINNCAGMPREGFEDCIAKMIASREGEGLPEGYVPETFYILWDDDGTPVGQFRLRHYLCESLRTGAGHIGYSIRDGYRGRGYGTEGLRLLLKEAEHLIPEPEAYLRVNKDNPASLKVMLHNGARIAGEDEEHYLTRIPLREGDREPIFSSERIDFVRLTPELTDDYVTMVNDAETSMGIRNEAITMTRNEEMLWVAKQRTQTDTLFSMLEKETGRFIGNIELFNKEEKHATLGICLTPEMQNRHFGTEAIHALLDHGFRRFGYDEILLDVFSTNQRALHCYRKIGFAQTGETPMTAPDGSPMTEIHMTYRRNA